MKHWEEQYWYVIKDISCSFTAVVVLQYWEWATNVKFSKRFADYLTISKIRKEKQK